jgi:hypothetical protein
MVMRVTRREREREELKHWKREKQPLGTRYVDGTNNILDLALSD